MQQKNLNDLCIKHPYCCFPNYIEDFDNFQDFLDDWSVYDIDLELCFRWDCKKLEDGEYSILFVLVQQRKNTTYGIRVNNLVEEDVPKIQEWLKPHQEHFKKLNEPF